MKTQEADEVLSGLASDIDAAVLHWDNVIADAHHNKALAMRAWTTWDLETLLDLGILTERSKKTANEALDALQGADMRPNPHLPRTQPRGRAHFNTTPLQFLKQAVELIESQSIRAWALSAHNRPLWTQLAHGWQRQHGDTPADVRDFSTYITLTAMG